MEKLYLLHMHIVFFSLFSFHKIQNDNYGDGVGSLCIIVLALTTIIVHTRIK
jgi:hypothetical protein